MSASILRVAFALSAVVLAGSFASAQESPTIDSVSFFGRPILDDTYGPGDLIRVRVTFSETVEVDGDPRLVLQIGDSRRSTDLYFVQGAQLYFRTFVEVSDLDEDGISIPADALLLNRGSIRDLDGNDAVLTHAASPDDPKHRVNGRLDAVPKSFVRMWSRPRAGDTYGLGESIAVILVLSEPVYVEGSPKLTLQVGTRTHKLNLHRIAYNALFFEHIVGPDDVDLDGVSIPGGAVDLDGGSIKDADGNDADLNHRAVPDDPGHKVDGTDAVPAVSSLQFGRSPGTGGTYEAGESILPLVWFTKPVDVTGKPQLALQVGTQTRLAKFIPRGLQRISGFHQPVDDPNWVMFEYVVQPSDLDEDGVGIPANALSLNGGAIRAVADDTSANLNHEARPDDPGHKVDGGRSDSQGPSVRTLRVEQPISGVYVAGDTISVSLDMSENVRVTGAPQLMIRIGSYMRAAELQGKYGPAILLFEYVVTESDRDDNGISIAADAVNLNGGSVQDGNGNDADLDLGYFAFDDNPAFKVNGTATPVPALPAAGMVLLAVLLAWRGGTRGCTAPAAPRIFVSLLLAGCLAPAPAAAQTLSERHEPLALTATEPELSGSVYIGGDPQADNHRTPLPDGTPLRAQQVPRFLRPAHDGSFGFDDFLVIGDHPTVTFERIDWDEDTPTAWRRETWHRASTRTVTGRLVSVFHPRWPAHLLHRRLRRGSWGVDVPHLYWGRLLLPGGDGESRRVTLNVVPPNIPPSPVVRINDSVQYASHVVNIRVPDFGDLRIQQGDLSFNLPELTRQFFYEHFADEYELIAVVTDANQLSRWGGAHTKRRNDISGIGLPLFDDSGYHGSEGVLQAVETWDGGRAWSSWSGVLHETGHQYGEYSKVWDSLRPPLVRRGHNPRGHTPLLYPGAVAYGAVLYGNRRVARIRSAGRPDRFEIEPTLPLFTYHPLTLYRMGLLPASEVPDMLVFHDQGQFNPSSNASPRPGTAVTGGATVVTIDDLIAADGVREGPVVTEIRRATVYVSRERLVPKEQMDILNYFARRLGVTTGVTSWDRRPSFAEATRGGAVMTTDIRPLGRPAVGPGPAEVTCAKVGTTALVGVVLDREVGGCLRTGDTVQVSGRLTLGDRPDYDRVCIRFKRYPDADPQDRVFECAPLDAGNRFALEATLHRPGGYQMEAFARWPGSSWQRPLTSYSGAVEVRDAHRNRAPQAVGAFEDRTLTVGGPVLVVDVSRAFSDPDGDVLTYAAVSSSPGVATAAVSAGMVTLTPVRPGSVAVTVTATDPSGLGATQQFAVTVAARATFTDHPIVPGTTPIRAIHFTELRDRIDALRRRGGLPAFRWTDRTLVAGVTPVRRVHLTELRSALDGLYDAAGRPRPAYADAPVAAGATPVRAAHIMELRAAVLDVE